jgi:hypothetical protein
MLDAPDPKGDIVRASRRAFGTFFLIFKALTFVISTTESQLMRISVAFIP